MRSFEEISLSFSFTNDLVTWEEKQTAAIDELNRRLALQDPNFLAKDVVAAYDVALGASALLSDMFLEMRKNKIARQEDITRAISSLVAPMKKLRETDDMYKLIGRARCYVEGVSSCGWGTPLQEVHAPKFRKLVIEVMRQNVRSQLTLNFLSEAQSDTGWWSWTVMDAVGKIESWIEALGATLVRGATGEAEPFIDEQVEKALAEARKAAEEYAEDQRRSTRNWAIGIGLGVVGIFAVWKLYGRN